LREDEADTFAVLVSSLSTDPRIADHTARDDETDSTMVDLLDHFAVLDDRVTSDGSSTRGGGADAVRCRGRGRDAVVHRRSRVGSPIPRLG
jgi:hypothetical protein